MPLGFITRFIAAPKTVGSVFPSSRLLAESLVNEIDLDSVVVELGGGTGSVARILRERGLDFYLVELDQYFALRLRTMFPDVSIFHGCATEYLKNCEIEKQIICSIPLFNNPNAPRLTSELAKAIIIGRVTKVVGFTYVPRKIDFGKRIVVEYRRFCLWNLPPAWIWIARLGDGK